MPRCRYSFFCLEYIISQLTSSCIGQKKAAERESDADSALKRRALLRTGRTSSEGALHRFYKRLRMGNRTRSAPALFGYGAAERWSVELPKTNHFPLFLVPKV